MESSTEQRAGGMVLRLSGRLDAQAEPELERVLTKALDTDTPRLIVDMNSVDYICSTCIRALLQAVKRVKAEDRFMELIRTRPNVRKVLMMVGLDELLPLGEGAMQIIDVLQQRNPYNDQALRNARQFLEDLFQTMGLNSHVAQEAVESIFRTCRTTKNWRTVEAELKELLSDLNLRTRLEEVLRNRPAVIHDQIAPYIGQGSILDIGAGDGRIAATFRRDKHDVQLIDVVDFDQTRLPCRVYDGRNIPFPDKSFDYSLLITVLHHCATPLNVIREAIRVTRRRIVVNEPVYLNETHRRFNMFFHWFHNRVLHDDLGVAYNFNTPEGWEHIFREEGLVPAAGEDLGLDLPAVPEYHWMFVLDVP